MPGDVEGLAAVDDEIGQEVGGSRGVDEADSNVAVGEIDGAA